jgi:hypothetical protein
MLHRISDRFSWRTGIAAFSEKPCELTSGASADVRNRLATN